MRITFGAVDRDWVATNLARVQRTVRGVDPGASVHVVRATVFVETCRRAEVLSALALSLVPEEDYRWINMSE